MRCAPPRRHKRARNINISIERGRIGSGARGCVQLHDLPQTVSYHLHLHILELAMDGFDDLLAPTRDALEKNPFADPFGKRSDSPDPWTSFQNSSSSLAHDVGGFGDTGSFASPTLDSPAFGGMPASGFHDYSHHEESTASAHEEPVHTEVHEQVHEPIPVGTSGPLSPRSPGFRESVSTTAEDTITHAPLPPPVQRQPSPPIPTSPTESSAAPSAITSPVSPPAQPSIFGHGFQEAPSPPASSFMPPRQSAERPFFSPLEQPVSSMDRSFTGLSIGGETVNGWQGAQSTFVGTTKPPTQEEEDDDDDKPILQALNERAMSSAGPVRYFHPLYNS